MNDDKAALAVGRAEALRRIGHSLRTPLNAITGATQMLAATDLSADQRDGLEAIRIGSDSLLSAVNDLLDISEIESDGLELQRIPFRLPETIREAIRTIRPLALDRGIDVSVHGLSSLPTDVVGDPGRLRQVIARLVDNAVRFTYRGSVQVGAELLAHDVDEVTVRFAVRDSGIGIPAQEIDRIFEPFAQGERGADTVTAGLGLTISRAVVRAMGGDITVESTLNRGSTFGFTIRLARHVEHRLDRGPAPPASGWVVIVGDRPEVNHSVAAVLRAGGLEPTEFEAVPLASASVALSDDPSAAPIAVVAVPSSVPFRMAERIMGDRQLSRSPVILVPPLGQRGDGEECIRLGIEGYLPQPVSPVDLIEAVREVAAGSHGSALVTRHWLRERRRSLRVLVVDDSPTGRALVMRALEGLGHDPESAATGREAVDRVAAEPFDVVLMDMEMPEMDGIEATRRIRASGSRVPIIGVSAHAFAADRRACLEAGMDDHVTKPFRLETLQLAMERLTAPG